MYAGAYLPVYGPMFDSLQHSWGFAPGCAGLIYYVARFKSRLARLVENRRVIALGDASYSIYLLHPFVFWGIFHGDLSDPVFNLLRLALTYAGIVLLSLAVYRSYEVPSRRLIRSWLAPRRFPVARTELSPGD